MERLRILAFSNFRKNKGTSVGLFLLMVLASALIGLSLLMFLDAHPTAKKEAERLDAGDGYIWITDDISGIDDEYVKNLIGDETKDYYMYNSLGYSTVSLPFGNGSVAPQLLVNDDSAFEKRFDRTEVVSEDENVEAPYIYLPYQFNTSGGYDIGDEYAFELLGSKYEFTVKGFTTSTFWGCNNTGVYEFVIDNDSYAALYEKDGATADSVVISFKLKNPDTLGSFKIKKLNEVLAINPASVPYIYKCNDAVETRSFMSLILAVSLLTVISMLVLVITLMLTNSISNYIKENMKSIGALKAIGYTSGKIRASLYVLFLVLALFGSIFGAGLSYLLMNYLSGVIVGQMGIPYEVSFNPVCSVIPVVFVFSFVFLISSLATGKIRKIEPIVALRDGVENHSFRKNRVRLDSSVFGLNLSLAFKTLFINLKQNIITFFVTGILIFICVVSLLMYENFSRNPKLGILTFETCGGVAAFDNEVKDEARKYLESRSDVSDVRSLITLTFNYNDEESLTTYIFEDPSKMQNKEVCYKGRLPIYDNEVAVSGKFAKVVGVSIGEEIKLDYGAKSNSYLITGLVQTCNNSGREAVMSRQAAEHLIDLSNSPDYYWFDCEDIEASRIILEDCTEKYGDHIISTMNFYEMLEGNLTTFSSVSVIMLILVGIIAAVVIMLILFLLIKAFIYSKRRDYGIYKAMGFTSDNLIFQTAFSFMPSITVAAVVFSIVSYFTANSYMGMIMGIFGLMKCTFVIPIPGVVIIGVCLIAVSFLFALIQSGKIRNIEAYEMLIGE